MFMQIGDSQILTLKIPLKCLGLCGKHASLSSQNFHTQNSSKICGVYLPSMQVWLIQILTPQNSTNSKMDFSIK